MCAVFSQRSSYQATVFFLLIARTSGTAIDIETYSLLNYSKKMYVRPSVDQKRLNVRTQRQSVKTETLNLYMENKMQPLP